MELQALLVCLQDVATGSYPEPYESGPRHHTLFL